MIPISITRPLDMTTRSRKMVDLDRIGLNLRYPRRRLDNRYEAWKGWYGMLLDLRYQPKSHGRGYSFGYIGHGITRTYYAPRKWPEKKSGGYLRKCTVKISFSRESGAKGALCNGKKVGYISREEATLASSKPFYDPADGRTRCYTYDGDRKVMITNQEASRILGEDGLYRIILSPEDPDVDLSEFAYKFMRQAFSKAVGCYSPLWVAANHYNTSHPHVHILMSRIRPNALTKGSVRDDGIYQKYLYFNKSYLKKNILYRDACRILTDFLGPRTPEQERFYTQKKIEDPGYTSLDRTIYGRSEWDKDEKGVRNISYQMFSSLPFSEKQLVRRRLKHLAENNPKVSYDSERKTWILQPGWDLILRRQEMLDDLKLDQVPHDDIVFDDKETKAYKGVIKSFSVDDDDPEKLTFHIVDEKGRSHVIEERISLDVDRSLLKEKKVQIGFLKHGTVPHILGKSRFEKDDVERRKE